jgi:hypothetical protein
MSDFIATGEPPQLGILLANLLPASRLLECRTPNFTSVDIDAEGRTVGLF